ncbi:MAG: translational GTPase TypA [Patescibacteria group bacterium]
MSNLRNVAIIAHVDHGKTTLVDALLRQSKTFLNKEQTGAELIMDSNDLEKERGITIFSKNASVQYNDTKINIIDTPGHSDFGGEVERVLQMANGCLLLIDAKEGPMPQTRFVLRKALEMKLKVIVVINKIDKPDARINEVLNRTFDLFIELGADDATADFPILYAAAKMGKAGLEPKLEDMTDITPIFDAIIKYIPEPTGDPAKPLQLLVTTLTADSFKGRIATGRIYNGKLTAGQNVVHIDRKGVQKTLKLTSIMAFSGLGRTEVETATAGDIVALAGVPEANIGETIADPENPIALPLLTIEEPTVKMTFSVNDSPFAGKEGDFTTSRQIRERLFKELETDTALRVTDGPQSNWVVCGRGELHLAILIERLRREGYELQVSRPQVIVKEIDGKKMVPYDQIFIEVPEAYSGAVIQKLGSRHGEMQNMTSDNGIVYIEFIIPTRGLFGYRNEFLTDTRGLGIMNTMFYKYMPDPGAWKERDQGSLVAHETGQSNLYGLRNVQDRGVMFIGPGIEVYKGQVVGQHARSADLSVNICKAKQLSNMRSKGDGTDEHFKAPRIMDLDASLEYIGDDELVEVTPKNIRMRKMTLDKSAQRRKELGIE